MSGAVTAAEEYYNYPRSPANPDRRRFVDKQRSWDRNIFQMDILKRSDCCTEARRSIGSCFLAKVDVRDATMGELQLNTDPNWPFVYLLTAAHNLYCRIHAKYAESIDLVRMKPGQHVQGKESLLREPVTWSFFRVSSLYKSMKREQAKTRDFGVICVARYLFLDPKPVASSFLNLQGPVEDQYTMAFVCGFPARITRNHGIAIDIPQTDYRPESEPELKKMVPGCSQPVDRFFVAGALYEMPAPPLTSRVLSANGGMQERSVAERSSAGLFAFPQKHFDELAKEIDYRTDSHCRQWLYRHYIDTSAGQSGSPVYIVDDAGTATVVGIHVGVWFYTANAAGEANYKHDTDCNIAVRLTNRMLTEVIFLTRQETTVAVESGEAQSLPHPNNVLPYKTERQMISFAAQKPNAAAAAAAAAAGGGASSGDTPTQSTSTVNTRTPSDSAEAAPVRPPLSGAADGNGQVPVQEGGAVGESVASGAEGGRKAFSLDDLMKMGDARFGQENIRVLGQADEQGFNCKEIARCLQGLDPVKGKCDSPLKTRVNRSLYKNDIVRNQVQQCAPIPGKSMPQWKLREL